MNWWSGVIKKVNKSPTNMAICTFKVQSAFKTTHDTFSVCSVWIKFSMRAIPSARCFFARGLFFHWCVPCSFGTLMTQIGLFVRNSVRECRVNAYKQRAKAATRKRIIIFILWYGPCLIPFDFPSPALSHQYYVTWTCCTVLLWMVDPIFNPQLSSIITNVTELVRNKIVKFTDLDKTYTV